LLLAEEGGDITDMYKSNITNMERYVRATMSTLLNYLARPSDFLNNTDDQKTGYEITMKDLSAYCEYFPENIRLAYKDQVERILNMNGHSLMLQAGKKFEPEALAALFPPVAEPALTIGADEYDAVSQFAMK